MKTHAKKKLSSNRIEMLKTGGGSADLQKVDDYSAFNFRPVQIEGLANLYDSNAIDGNGSDANVSTYQVFEVSDSQNVTQQSNGPNSSVHCSESAEVATVTAILTTPKTGNAMMDRFSKPRTPKTVVEMNPELLELRKRKAELEVQFLEIQIKKAEMEAEMVKTTTEKNKLKIAKLRKELNLPAEDQAEGN